MNSVVRTALAIMALAAFAAAQGSSPQTGSKPAGQAPTQSQGQPQAQTPPAAAAPAGPARRLPPAAKTQEELNAYQTAATNPDLAAAEKGAEDFATKFPQSELRPLLYSSLMRRYQQADNAEKTLDMAHKVLQYTPDDSIALVMSSTVLAERTRDSDIDKDERLAEAVKNAEKAITTIDTGLMVPPTATAEQIQGAKNTVLSMAHQALGTVALTQNQDARAEQEFGLALAINPGNVDPLVYLRMAIAQDHQKKYSEALANANKAVESAGAGSPVAALASKEVERLKQLTGGASPAAATAPKSPAPSATPAPPTTPK